MKEAGEGERRRDETADEDAVLRDRVVEAGVAAAHPWAAAWRRVALALGAATG